MISIWLPNPACDEANRRVCPNVLQQSAVCRWREQHYENELESNLSDWPPHFPESCPPDDAQPTGGSFYRLVKADPAASGDFVSNLRRQQLGISGKKRKWSDDCVAAALSIFTDLRDVEATRAAFGRTIGEVIAYGDITGDGVMKHTPSRTSGSHHSWWLTIESRPELYFRTFA